MKSVRIYHSILNVMFENTVQIVGSQFITIQTQDTAYKLLTFWFSGEI